MYLLYVIYKYLSSLAVQQLYNNNKTSHLPTMVQGWKELPNGCATTSPSMSNTYLGSCLLSLFHEARVPSLMTHVWGEGAKSCNACMASWVKVQSLVMHVWLVDWPRVASLVMHV